MRKVIFYRFAYFFMLTFLAGCIVTEEVVVEEDAPVKRRVIDPLAERFGANKAYGDEATETEMNIEHIMSNAETSKKIFNVDKFKPKKYNTANYGNVGQSRERKKRFSLKRAREVERQSRDATMRSLEEKYVSRMASQRYSASENRANRGKKIPTKELPNKVARESARSSRIDNMVPNDRAFSIKENTERTQEGLNPSR